MSHVFGRYVLLDDDGNYHCGICDRRFFSESAIYSHCRNTGNHEWCERCERVFVTEDSILAHLRFSSVHNLCNVCEQDFANYPSLKQHQLLAHCLCDRCDIPCYTPSGLHHHIVSEHFGCKICSRSFGGENGLAHHMKVHEEKDIECPACDRDFSRFSYLLLHIERSRCFPINQIEDLIDQFGKGRLDRQPDDLPGGSFSCENCGGTFRRLSGLFQHVEDAKECSYLLRFTGDDGDLESLMQYVLENLAYCCRGILSPNGNLTACGTPI